MSKPSEGYVSVHTEEKVFTSRELGQLFDLTFIVSPNWRILVDVHTPAGDGWATLSTWIDSSGNMVTRGKSAASLGQYVWSAVQAGCRVRVVKGEQL